MSLKVRFAKAAMKVFPARPTIDLNHPMQEYFRHTEFKMASEAQKQKTLFTLAKNHYLEDQSKPFDLFFSGYSLRELLRGKKILDLGCGTGGHILSCAERWA